MKFTPIATRKYDRLNTLEIMTNYNNNLKRLEIEIIEGSKYETRLATDMLLSFGCVNLQGCHYQFFINRSNPKIFHLIDWLSFQKVEYLNTENAFMLKALVAKSGQAKILNKVFYSLQ